MELNLGELTSIEIDLVNKGNTLARVVWIFEKAELKWGRVSISKNGGLWVQVPKFKCGQAWVAPIKILDSVLEDKLARLTLEEYEKRKNSIEDEDINLDDIKP
ncbi:MAG: hypothetical protein WCV58_00755 [Patescibacteria group bacterium]|jgi:hypothetical protein